MSKKMQIEQSQVYRYCGDGDGIPGLPKEMTMASAYALGLGEQFQAAVEHGDYQLIEIEKEATNG
jgi:hypothetical protein